jgi:hypothetical protein
MEVFYIGICPFCEQGPISFRKCSSGDLVFVCPECYLMWYSPDDIRVQNSVSSDDKDVRCSDGNGLVWGENSEWATPEEIEAHGLSHYIQGQYTDRKPPIGRWKPRKD